MQGRIMRPILVSVSIQGEMEMKTPRLLRILGCLTIALLGLVACVAPTTPDAAEPMAEAEPEVVEIEYWQYV